MFDLGFQELILIGVIALIVVGPERLPKMARTLGLWSGRIRYYVNQVRNDIDREVRAQELRELLDKPAAELGDLSSVAEEAKSALGEAKAAIEAIPKGISTPDDPAAGSILPSGRPDPAQGKAEGAQVEGTPEPSQAEASAVRSGELPDQTPAPPGGPPRPARTETNPPQSGEPPPTGVGGNGSGGAAR